MSSGFGAMDWSAVPHDYVDGGYVPYARRTREQREAFGYFHERVARIRTPALGEIPDRCLFADVYREATAGLTPPRVRQVTGSCLPGHAPVRMADGMEKAIKDIVPGDMVITHTGVARKVLGVQSKVTQEQMRRIRVIGWAERLYCTDGHMVPSWNGKDIDWIRAEEVTPEHFILTGYGTSVGKDQTIDVLDYIHGYDLVARRVVSNEAIGVPEDSVYDIEVDVDHTFLAWDFVVHNCVGAATFLLYLYTQASDIVFRGSPEQLFLINPYFAWGYGRRIARMGGPGDGSYGGAQAKASKEFGQVPIDTPGSPQPSRIWLPQGGRSHWHQWTESVEYALSWPSKWPIAEAQIAEVANKLQITGIQRIATVEDLIGAIAIGKPPTLASMFGSRPSVKNGFLVGEWNATWAHQMSIGGFFKHPSLGMLFLIDNQWGPDAHGPLCPFLREQLGMDGSFWISEQTMSRILNNDDAECWVHLDTEDRLAPTIDVWDEIANAA